MAVNKDFAAYVQELLASLGPIRIRAMFGGAGVYADDLMFALIADDVLYLRVDAQTEAQFKAAGSEPFTYRTSDGAEMVMSYWRAPDDALENPDEAASWARLSLDAALRKQAGKGKSKRRNGRG